MANQRASGKRLIGAHISLEMSNAIDAWLLRNPDKTMTDFLITAAFEKLTREGISLDMRHVVRRGRGRNLIEDGKIVLNVGGNTTVAREIVVGDSHFQMLNDAPTKIKTPEHITLVSYGKNRKKGKK